MTHRKIYVVGDGKREPEEPEIDRGPGFFSRFWTRIKNFFKGIYKWFKILLVFIIGLILGLFENEQADDFIEDINYEEIVGRGKFGNGLRKIGDSEYWEEYGDELDSEWLESPYELGPALGSLWKAYDHKETYHYRCRLECRNITHEEVRSAVTQGRILEYNPMACFQESIRPKYNVYKEFIGDKDLEVVFSVDHQDKEITLITAYRPSDKKDPCGTKKCN